MKQNRTITADFSIEDCCLRFSGEFAYQIHDDLPERVSVEIKDVHVNEAKVAIGIGFATIHDFYPGSLRDYVWSHCASQLEARALEHCRSEVAA